ncbi:MAG TPA: sigma-54 dependent transcriptional regulator [Polyangiales bacterium]
MSYRGSMQILIVDDQPAMREALELLFEVHGLPAISAANAEQALALIKTEDVGLVIQDMNFQEGETSGAGGMALFRSIRALVPELPVLLMTAWTSLETAVELVKEGAADYMAKPWNDDKLLSSVRNLLRLSELAQENARLLSHGARARRALEREYDLCGLVYTSSVMHELVSLAVKVAPSDVPVLITGPNGSGKELIAEIVRNNSRRRSKPFVKVNAGGLPDTLLEAELFGAEAGAFTGATKSRPGRFEAAQDGTLFLDELGNLSASGQMRLLRVLQSGEYERLGSNVTRTANVRVVSATNADLPRAIAAGAFREDLYYRLNVIELRLPSLAERSEDILPLAEHVLRQLGTDAGPCELAPDAREALLGYDWPGNVRELQNHLRRASLVCVARCIRASDLALPGATRAVARSPDGVASREPVEPLVRNSAADEAERAQVEEALTRAGGVVSKAATQLGLSRQSLYRRMERLGLSVERRVRE